MLLSDSPVNAISLEHSSFGLLSVGDYLAFMQHVPP